ncbi:DUF6207 family protein [Streptomyces albogriseolus]|uniref:DUF6207 family protein n=1 Tax=Streptomyces albogriseolus TaxID=1887 RepID=UPI0037B98A77
MLGLPYPNRVTLPGRENSSRQPSVVPGMKPLNDAHVAEPGLAVVEVAAADDQTAFAIQELLATRWATALADRTVREPGEPGVRLRCYLDLWQAAAPAWGRWRCRLARVRREGRRRIAGSAVAAEQTTAGLARLPVVLRLRF